MRFSLLALLLILITGSAIAQQRQIADQVVAVVNNNIILKSDVDQRVFEFMQQQQMQEFDENIWYYVLESMVDNHVLIEKARIDSIVVSDAEVERMLDQRIDQLIQQVGSESELEQAFGQPIIEIKAEYSEEFRRDMLVNRVRQQRSERINITRPEVVEYFEEIPQDSLPMIPESVALSQITTVPPPKPDARRNALELTEQLRDSIIHHGASMEDLARTYSDGPTAERGGGLPMVSTTDLLPEYAAAAAALEPGEISEVVDTPQGLHIIRLNERSGQNISTHHILISIDEEELDEQYAIDKLAAIRDSLMHHDRSFAEMAREHSEDPNTAPSGGRLMNPRTGQRHIPLNELDSSLYRIVMLLDETGEISEPRSYQYGEEDRLAYRIVQLNDRIEEHRANLDQDYQLIRNFALQQKQQEILSNWIEDLRSEMYVEYRVSVPDLDLDEEISPMTPEMPTDEIPTEEPVQQQPLEQ